MAKVKEIATYYYDQKEFMPKSLNKDIVSAKKVIYQLDLYVKLWYTNNVDGRSFSVVASCSTTI